MSNSDSFAYGNAFSLLAAARPQSGPAGQRFGKGSGSSLEFQEFRDYQIGDDLRHVDWRVFARTKTLTTRLYREEISATVELVVDGSRSMAVSEAKASMTRTVAAFLAGAAQGESMLRAVLAADPPTPLAIETLRDGQAKHFPFKGAAHLGQLPLKSFLRPGTVRILISDFLFPFQASELMKRLGAQASTLLVLQILAPEEWNPTNLGALRFTDVESQQTRDLTIDAHGIGRYRQRLQRLCDDLQAETKRAGGHYHRILAGASIQETVLQQLMPAGLVEPR